MSSEEEKSENEYNSSDDDNDESFDENDQSSVPMVDNNVDENTLRIMVSTDNHLGYLEKDAVRGLDSFAAFEEVLILAKKHKCDFVLLSGDLFHENKPSRRTLWKTMDILRRHCMGPDPVGFQIFSNQANNFRNACVNYEDPFYSVDLPIFSIHGNHDDPTRDGGTDSSDMLAALDLLSICNLVNYFGTIQQVDNVNISPILMRKGSTNVALYGMGNLRDERLNRMWQSKKVRFLKPNQNDTQDDHEEENDSTQPAFFNIFALHQNRDLGRGSKNCVHESMIPEWMDLVVWGHEHECQVNVTESLVGTFRITQPGSSVATSLVNGESVMKQVGILDIRGHQFRLVPVPLTQVRSFAMSDTSLNNQTRLDPDDPKIDDKVNNYLTKEVKKLIEEAREKARALQQVTNDASKSDSSSKLLTQKYKLKNPEEVLVRLKVEHSGFTTLNNQRFGAQFVGQIANPSDILLFHRRRQIHDAKNSKSNKDKDNSLLQTPIPPAELINMNVEDLIKDNLTLFEKKIDLLDEKKMSIALEHFVEKEQRGVIDEVAHDTLLKQQKKLVKRGSTNDVTKLTTAIGVREICQAESEKARAKAAAEAEEEKQILNQNETVLHDSSDDSGKYNDSSKMEPPKSRRQIQKSEKISLAKKVMENEINGNQSSRMHRSRPTRRAAAMSKKNKYTIDDDDDDDSVEVISDPDDSMNVDNLSDEEMEESLPPKEEKKTATSARSQRKTRSAKITSKSTVSSTARPRRRTRTRAVYEEEDSDEDNDNEFAETMKTWGVATSQSQTKRKRR